MSLCDFGCNCVVSQVIFSAHELLLFISFELWKTVVNFPGMDDPTIISVTANVVKYKNGQIKFVVSHSSVIKFSSTIFWFSVAVDSGHYLSSES
jgi:thioredoxin reductase